MTVVPVFVHYDGPKLDKRQKHLVRSEVMVTVRRQQRRVQEHTANTTAANNCKPRVLAPAPGQTRQHGRPSDSPRDDALHDGRNHGSKALVTRTNRHQWPLPTTMMRPDPWDSLRGRPPKQSTHATGVDARVFHEYLGRCGAYSAYLDEAFILVGFRQPSYFRPDLSKAACIYIGWLLTAGMLDAVRGGGRGTRSELVYPYFEYQAVRELQGFLDGAEVAELHQVVYPVVILGIFEVVRFNPCAITHLAAVGGFIKSRGGLRKMPLVMQHIVIMADLFQTVCFDTPLAFNVLGSAPTMRVTTATDGFPTGDNQLLSCPLLVCDDEDLAFAARFVDDPAVGAPLVAVLRAASGMFQRFFLSSLGSREHSSPSLREEEIGGLDLDALLAASPTTAGAFNNVPPLVLESCALAARIMRETLAGQSSGGFDGPTNELDALGIYHNIRFLGLNAWRGMPYIYVWVNLMGYAASTDRQMRSFFVAEVVRCAFSYGCYQLELFRAVLRNFIHLRSAVTASQMALSTQAGPGKQ